MSNERGTNSVDLNNNQVNKSGSKCKAEVLDSITLNECNNKNYIPMGGVGPLIAKIPVVLSDLEVQIDVESEIKLQEPAFDIKTVDKHVCLTQCKLIPFTNKLFIAGYVQKNIQFSTIDCVNETSVSGNIQHTTVNVPFKCVTKIKFSREPIYGKEYKKRLSALDKDMLCKDNQEDSWVHYSKLYEPVYCELEYAKVLETDFINSRSSTGKGILEMIEKMVIFIRLKVLQNQQVCIPEPDGDVIIIEKHGENSKKTFDDAKDKKYVKIEVGYDSEKGMIGKEVSANDFEGE